MGVSSRIGVAMVVMVMVSIPAMAEGSQGTIAMVGKSVVENGSFSAGSFAYHLVDAAETEGLGGIASSVSIRYVYMNETLLKIPSGGPGRIGDPEGMQVETSKAERASIRIAPNNDSSSILAWGDALPDTLGNAFARAELQAIERAVLVSGLAFAGSETAEDAPTAAEYFAFHVANVAALDDDDGAFRAGGAVSIYVWGADVTINDRTYQTGVTRLSSGPAADSVRRAYLVMDLQESDIKAFGGQGSGTLYADALQLSVAGLSGTGAGKLDAVDERIIVEDAFDLAGSLQLRAVLRGGASFDAMSAVRDDAGPVPYKGFDLSISGDIVSTGETRIAIAAPVTVATSIPAALIGLAALAGAIAYAWPLLKFHLTVLVIPLYTRLKEPELLDNEVRNVIYGIIKVNPGMSARAIHRESDHSWGTVVYHLRQLERHSLVKSRRVGRSRNFYENHGKYVGMEVELAALRSPKSAALAAAITQEPGITQEGLTERAGLPQSTVSYYVKKLKDAELIIEKRQGKYAAYYPVEDLERLLSLVVTNT